MLLENFIIISVIFAGQAIFRTVYLGKSKGKQDHYYFAGCCRPMACHEKISWDFVKIYPGYLPEIAGKIGSAGFVDTLVKTDAQTHTVYTMRNLYTPRTGEAMTRDAIAPRPQSKKTRRLDESSGLVLREGKLGSCPGPPQLNGLHKITVKNIS